MRTLDESTLIGEVVERLTAKHPQVPADDVARVVNDALARFDGCHIREFVPLFVERRARAQLAQPQQELAQVQPA